MQKHAEFNEKYRVFRRFVKERMGGSVSDQKIFDLLDEQLNDVGIFSLSELADHPLMWAHYAQDHRGKPCLGFEIVQLCPLADSELCLRVSYADAIPKMENGFIQDMTFRLDEHFRLQSTSRIAFS